MKATLTVLLTILVISKTMQVKNSLKDENLSSTTEKQILTKSVIQASNSTSLEIPFASENNTLSPTAALNKIKLTIIEATIENKKFLNKKEGEDSKAIIEAAKLISNPALNPNKSAIINVSATETKNLIQNSEVIKNQSKSILI